MSSNNPESVSRCAKYASDLYSLGLVVVTVPDILYSDINNIQNLDQALYYYPVAT